MADELDSLINGLQSDVNKHIDTAHHSSGERYCHKCQRPILAKRVESMGHNFHEECWSCSQCHTLLGTDEFFHKDDLAYCAPCYKAKYLTPCSECGEHIIGKFVDVFGRQVHASCFRCTGCRTPFPTASYYPKNNQAYCVNCVENH
eukprot:TRINITY_DN1356_c0_g1_i1.p1 TRINITY_DN1356_c0_g1~~TRINITY_DN1356_c0_g1_i1.p1  ORF type:complete len:146 (-),score=11.31 TRINITY_DN1356_c0_g1_i1:162-599(-)